MGGPGRHPPAPGLSALRADPGLCGRCRHALLTRTTRGPVYIRCGRAAWDPRLVRYPRLPVLACVGHEPPAGPGCEDPAP